MIQHRKKHISNLVLGHLSSSPLLGLVRSLIGWHVFTSRLSEKRPLHAILAFYCHRLFNRVGGSMAETVSLWESITDRDYTKRKLHTQRPRDRVTPQVLPLRGDSSQHAPQTLHSPYSPSAFACLDVLFSYICQDGIRVFMTASYQRESDPIGSIDCAEQLNVIWAAAWTCSDVVLNTVFGHQKEDEEERERKEHRLI